ncbi:glycosyltransferase [Intestinibacter sp.]
MKVLQINSVCGYGSTGRIAVSLYNAIADDGGECLIAYGRKEKPSGYNTYKIGNKFDNYMHGMRSRIFDKHGFGSKRPTLKLIEKIKEYDPDIIHLHNIHGYYLNIQILFQFLKEYKKPIVWTLHDCWAFTGHCSNYTSRKCYKWKTQCKNCPEKKSYPASLLLDNSKNNYILKQILFTDIENVTIITPSNWLKDSVKQSFLKKHTVKVINNGIDLDLFRIKESTFKKNNNIEDKFMILGVANEWGERKGLQHFIEMNKRLNDKFKIVLVGLTEKQKKQIPNGIIAISRTRNIEELVDLYSSADVFVNPTLEDNFPTTNLEAIACGTPVITFDSGGSGESVIPFTTGFVVKSGDLNKVISIIENKEFKNIKAEDCRKRAQLYSDKLKFKEYVELYKTLLKN